MIYTVTLNPAVDYVMHLPRLCEGSVNRAEHESIFFGGKGINVSLVLAQLDVPSIALGFIAGFTGMAIEAGLHKQGIQTDFIRLPRGNSRINVKLRTGEETDINGNGPDIPPEALQTLLAKLEALQAEDILVLAGSIPQTLPVNGYEKILAVLQPRGVRCVVDATGELLKKALLYRPFLIKPNAEELGILYGQALTTREAVLACAVQAQRDGAQNVLVSMAGDGALLLDAAGKTHVVPAVRGKAVNSVGAGDAMVAGFLAGFLPGGDYDSALRLGAAAGSATAFSEGLAEREKICTLLEQYNAMI